MTYLIKEIDVSRIYLVNENPRHDPIENEPEIIQYLITHENVKPLARHIANAGCVDGCHVLVDDFVDDCVGGNPNQW